MDANRGRAATQSRRGDVTGPDTRQLPGEQVIPCLGRFRFKIAETDVELEQVHRLNYRTFVQEIPQHGDNGTGRLVDKFHDWNTYFLALDGERLIGMLSVHDRAPFSVESRLSDPSVVHRPGMRPLEVRLLAIEPAERHGPVLVGLTYAMNCHARREGYTHFLISAVTSQIPLYGHLGFEALGPACGRPGAQFVPMIATLEAVTAAMQRTMVLWERRAEREAKANKRMAAAV
jgi:hypothetical protein